MTDDWAAEPEYGDDLAPERPRPSKRARLRQDLRSQIVDVLRGILAEPDIKATLQGSPGTKGDRGLKGDPGPSIGFGGGGGGITVSGSPINALAAGSGVTITTSGGTATVATSGGVAAFVDGATATPQDIVNALIIAGLMAAS